MKQIKEEQLKELQEVIAQTRELTSEVGTLEFTKQRLIAQLAQVDQKMSDIQKTLLEEYGSVNVNIETGEITEQEGE
jgi:ABC-type uncharacterized transport system involved in gliding motility auxiliary subunit